MKANEVVKDIMKTRGHTNKSLSTKLGYPNPSGVSERIRNSNDMKVSILLKMLKAMDCELVVRSSLSEKKEWNITDGEMDLEALLSDDSDDQKPKRIRLI